MESSSSPLSVHKSFKYDVFLSFRGEDTRKNFVDHLYNALQRKSILTYKDDREIKKGERISDELLGSIEKSRFYIIVFSRNYASSSWCLDELVKIMEECRKMPEHTAYPIFYDVEPTEIRNQSGAVGKAFAKHKKEAAGKWRNALEEAAGLAGWELKSTANGHEAIFIQKVVDQLSLELRLISVIIDEQLVGMETRIKDVVKLLGTGFDDVRMIGIKGIGGGGKTTLARAIFDRISYEFDGKSFVENVREISKDPSSGLKSLQKKILSDVLNDKDISVSGVYDGKDQMRRTMCDRKVLIVLDDVDATDQLEALVGKPSWFKMGSIVIITTRDEQVLIAHDVKLIHDVVLLLDKEAICLFSRCAFGREAPKQGYEKLSGRVVRYANGLPLTIRVLGSLLCGKDEFEWGGALDRLKKIPLNETLKQLELSYTGLEEDHKEIFLGVACILKGWQKKDAIKALDSCGFNARYDLGVLEQKSLITISISYGEEIISMHDHIEELGKNIVRRLHPHNPNRHSRLWIDDEIEDILSKNSGMETTRYIKFYKPSVDPQIVMKGLRKIKELRFLCVLQDVESYSKSNTFSPYFPDALRFLCWSFYPFRSLPKTFQATNLVALEMIHSGIVQLWEGGEKKVLKTLKFLDLRCSMLSILDLGLTPNLETLNLNGCCCLVELHIPDVCLKLRSFNMSYSKLSTLDLGMTPNLEQLNINHCNDLVKLLMPDTCLNLRYLELSNLVFKNLDIGLSPNLKFLNLEYSSGLEKLHMSGEYPNLTYFNISFSALITLDLRTVPNLENLVIENSQHLVVLYMPDELRMLQSVTFKRLKSLRTLYLGTVLHLEHLHIEDCHKLEELHMSGELRKLQHITFMRLESLRTLHLGTVLNLENLQIEDCHILEELHMSGELRKLQHITFMRLESLRTLHLGTVLNLEHLHIEDCHKLEELHMSGELRKLQHITFMRLELLRNLHLKTVLNLEHLHIEDCHKLEELHMSGKLRNLQHITFKRLYSLRTLHLRTVLNLELLNIEQCLKLEELNLPGELPKLKYLRAMWLNSLRTLHLGNALNLRNLSIANCCMVEELHMPSRCLNLTSINISYYEGRILDIRMTPNLEYLDLSFCYNLEELHMVDEYQKLRFLNLSYLKLRTLDLGLAPTLETLMLCECTDLVELHMTGRFLNLTSLKLIHSKLKTLYLGPTPNLEKLNLDSSYDLEELHIADEYQKLKFINLSYSKLRTLDLGMAPNLKTLILHECKDLVELRMPGRFLKLTSLELTKSKLKTLYLGLTPNLEKLDLAKSYDLEELHMADECHKLTSINISHSKLRTLCLGQTPNLEKLDLKECNNLEDLQVPIGCLNKLVYLDLSGCLRFKKFVFYIEDETFFSVDESLTVGPSAELHLIGESLEICPIHLDNNLPKFEFTCFYKEYVPSLTRNLEKLISFGLCACTNLEIFSGSICGLQYLRKLKLEGSIPEVPKDLDQLECLEELSLSSANIEYLPESICMLKHLKSLVLNRCSFLRKLPVDIGQLECLETLLIVECGFLRDIPNSICKMISLKHFHLRNCIRIEKLPEELGHLECLKEFVIECTGISHLPQSILLLKGLCIVGSRELLQLFGFTSEIQTLEELMLCYVAI